VAGEGAIGRQTKARRPHIPALGYAFLTRLYDPLVRATMPEERFRSQLLGRSRFLPGARVLDLGCGTGSLALLAERRSTAARWTGVDADEEVLRIASGKAGREGARMALVGAHAGALPFVDEIFDRVLSSLFFHHLTSEEKRDALAETFRVTAPGGELHVIDWGPPQGSYARIAFAIVTRIGPREPVGDNAAGRLPGMIEAAGFRSFGSPEHIPTAFGTLELMSARKPP
jgi:SAM-dependent methyltransferase